METRKKLNRAIHGEGNKLSPNMHRVTVYLYNPARKGSSMGKGSKDFKTTHAFKGIETLDKAVEVINLFAEGRSDGRMNYSMIKKAYYNGKYIIHNGEWVICT